MCTLSVSLFAGRQHLHRAPAGPLPYVILLTPRPTRLQKPSSSPSELDGRTYLGLTYSGGRRQPNCHGSFVLLQASRYDRSTDCMHASLDGRSCATRSLAGRECRYELTPPPLDKTRGVCDHWEASCIGLWTYKEGIDWLVVLESKGHEHMDTLLPSLIFVSRGRGENICFVSKHFRA